MKSKHLVPTQKEIDYQACWNHLKNYFLGMEQLHKYDPDSSTPLNENRSLTSTMEKIEKLYIRVKL